MIILGSPNEILQSITLDDDSQFTAVTIDDVTGKIAASTGSVVYVYHPYDQDIGALKVGDDQQNPATTANMGQVVTPALPYAFKRG